MYIYEDSVALDSSLKSASNEKSRDGMCWTCSLKFDLVEFTLLKMFDTL